MSSEFLAYGPTTPIGQVRALIRDTKQDDFIFSDQEINAFLSLEQQSVWRASALAIETTIPDSARSIRVVRALDLQVDAAKNLFALQNLANRWRDIGDRVGSKGEALTGIAYAENAHTTFGRRELEDRVLERTS